MAWVTAKAPRKFVRKTRSTASSRALGTGHRRMVNAGVIEEDVNLANAGGDGSSRLERGVIGDLDRHKIGCDSFPYERSRGSFAGGMTRPQQDRHSGPPGLPRHFKSDSLVRSGDGRDFLR